MLPFTHRPSVRPHHPVTKVHTNNQPSSDPMYTHHIPSSLLEKLIHTTALHLQNPESERDACGVGFIADITGKLSRETIDNALSMVDVSGRPSSLPRPFLVPSPTHPYIFLLFLFLFPTADGTSRIFHGRCVWRRCRHPPSDSTRLFEPGMHRRFEHHITRGMLSRTHIVA